MPDLFKKMSPVSMQFGKDMCDEIKTNNEYFDGSDDDIDIVK